MSGVNVKLPLEVETHLLLRLVELAQDEVLNMPCAMINKDLLL